MINEVDLKIEKSEIYPNLDILDDREKEVVVGRFGLDTGGEERTQRETAKGLGISRSYVSRIEKYLYCVLSFVFSLIVCMLYISF